MRGLLPPDRVLCQVNPEEFDDGRAEVPGGVSRTRRARGGGRRRDSRADGRERPHPGRGRVRRAGGARPDRRAAAHRRPGRLAGRSGRLMDPHAGREPDERLRRPGWRALPRLRTRCRSWPDSTAARDAACRTRRCGRASAFSTRPSPTRSRGCWTSSGRRRPRLMASRRSWPAPAWGRAEARRARQALHAIVEAESADLARAPVAALDVERARVRRGLLRRRARRGLPAPGRSDGHGRRSATELGCGRGRPFRSGVRGAQR